MQVKGAKIEVHHVVRNLYPVCARNARAKQEKNTFIPSEGKNFGFSFSLFVPLKIISLIMAHVVIACFRAVASL